MILEKFQERIPGAFVTTAVDVSTAVVHQKRVAHDGIRTRDRLVETWKQKSQQLFRCVNWMNFYVVEFFQPHKKILNDILVKLFNRSKLTFSACLTEFIWLKFMRRPIK